MSKMFHQCPVCSVKHNRHSICCAWHEFVAGVYAVVEAAAVMASGVLICAALWVLTR